MILKEEYTAGGQLRNIRKTVAELWATMPPAVKVVWRAGEAYGRTRGVRWGWWVGYSLGYRVGRFQTRRGN